MIKYSVLLIPQENNTFILSIIYYRDTKHTFYSKTKTWYFNSQSLLYANIQKDFDGYLKIRLTKFYGRFTEVFITIIILCQVKLWYFSQEDLGLKVYHTWGVRTNDYMRFIYNLWYRCHVLGYLKRPHCGTF